MTRFIAALLCVLLVSSLALPRHAEAQTTGGEAAVGTAGVMFTLTTTGVPLTIIAGIVITVVLIVRSDGMEDYLRQNEVEIAQDLSLGAGQTIDELAAAFLISDENKAEFGKLLRDHRTELLELAEPSQLNEERARLFIESIVVLGAERGVVDMDLLDAAYAG